MRKIPQSEIFMVTVGCLYYMGMMKKSMLFSLKIEEAYQFWNRESADRVAKEIGGRVIKFIEVE